MVSQGGDKELFEFFVGAGGDEGCDKSAAAGAGDDVGETILIEEGFDDAEVVVCECCAAGETEGCAAVVGTDSFEENPFLVPGELFGVDEEFEAPLDCVTGDVLAVGLYHLGMVIIQQKKEGK